MKSKLKSKTVKNIYYLSNCMKNSISVSIWSKTDGQTAERASVRSIFRCSDVLNANTRIGSALAGQSEMRGGAGPPPFLTDQLTLS